jgi:CHASE2 domain-containing sensor protein
VTYDEHALKASIGMVVEAVQREEFEEKALRLTREIWAVLAAPVIGLCIAVAAWVALLDPLTIDTRAVALTLRLAAAFGATRPPALSGQVVLLGIDSETERVIGRRFDESWRSEHARVIELAAQAGAKAIAFDLEFVVDGTPAVNNDLVTALRATKGRTAVVFGVLRAHEGKPAIQEAFVSDTYQGLACMGQRMGVLYLMPLAVFRAEVAPPLPSLALTTYARGGGLGPKLDGFTLELQAVQKLEGTAEPKPIAIPFFATEELHQPNANCLLLGPRDRVALQLIDPQVLPAWRDAPSRLPYESVLAGHPAALSALKDKFVVVGTMRRRSPDHDYHVVGARSVEPGRWGVELIASQLDALVRGDTIRQTRGSAQIMQIGAAAIAGTAVAVWLRRESRTRRTATLLALSAVIVAMAVYWYRSERQLINWPYLLLAEWICAWLAASLLRRKRRWE